MARSSSLSEDRRQPDVFASGLSIMPMSLPHAVVARQAQVTPRTRDRDGERESAFRVLVAFKPAAPVELRVGPVPWRGRLRRPRRRSRDGLRSASDP